MDEIKPHKRLVFEGGTARLKPELHLAIVYLLV